LKLKVGKELMNNVENRDVPTCPLTNTLCIGDRCILFNTKVGRCILPRLTNSVFSIEREMKELRRELNGQKYR